VDSRDYSDEFEGALRKLNDREALNCWSAITQRKIEPDSVSLEEVLSFLHQRWGKAVCLTRGERGALLMSDAGLQCVDGVQLSQPVDTVGAGDSMLAGMAAALSVGATFLEACELGNSCAAVTVQKLQQTGTANPREIVELRESTAAETDPKSDVEIIVEIGEGLSVRHAVFDHDGTVSTLREGWERVMEPMMTRAILGKQYNRVSKESHDRITLEVLEFIDRTTGLQTLSQMQALIEMIRKHEFVDRADILDVYAYKERYNDELMRSIQTRLDSLEEQRLVQSDLTLRGAPAFLERLYDSGVRLYLVSGTDQKDVEAEAHALGYGHLFENRIYGAVGDLQREAKGEVLDRILGDIGHDHVHELVTFGDGPVEIRASRKRGAFSVGVASDELRRHGWNDAKRTRLIRAGAHILIPDFSDPHRLFELLNLNPQPVRP
jgi:phosphoglycolate phosphatase-like HAD superfamily hydrolase